MMQKNEEESHLIKSKPQSLKEEANQYFIKINSLKSSSISSTRKLSKKSVEAAFHDNTNEDKKEKFEEIRIKLTRTLSKSFEEDQASLKDNQKTLISQVHVEDSQEEIVSSECDRQDRSPSIDEDPIEKINRRLLKRERICDTDTEDSAFDNENELKWIILPDCRFKQIWNFLIAIIILYSSIVTPLSIAFFDDDDTKEVIVEYVIDCILTIDIILNFFSAYNDKDENLIKSHKKIIKSYLKSWFLPDFISVFPFAAITSNSKYKLGRLNRISRLPKLYKLVKLTKLIRISKMTKSGNVSSMTKVVLEKLKLNSNIEKLLFFFLTFLLLSHLCTCIWYFVAKMEDFSPNTWVVRLGYIDSSAIEIYVLAFYWTLTTVTTVGYGDISAGTTYERIYNLIIMSFGVLMYSFAIGSLSSIVAAMDKKKAEMTQKLNLLSSIKKEYHLDDTLYDKVRKVIKFDISRNQRDKIQFLQELPTKLKIELSQIMHDKAIQNLNLFRDQPYDFFAYVVPLLKPIKFCQNDYLYKIDDMIYEMYFVSKGTIIFCLERKYGEKELKEIKKNNNFGEIEMCLNEHVIFNIKVKSRNCELFVLKKLDFLKISVNFNELIENFLERSLMIYTKYVDDRKKMIAEYEALIKKAHLRGTFNKDEDDEDYINPNSTIDEKVKEEDNDASNESDSKEKDSTYINNKKTIKKEELKTKMQNALVEKKLISTQFNNKQAINNDETIKPEKNPIELNSVNHKLNLKFQKKIEEIIEYLEENGQVFSNACDNPRVLFEELKNETSIAKREILVFKIEEAINKINNN